MKQFVEVFWRAKLMKAYYECKWCEMTVAKEDVHCRRCGLVIQEIDPNKKEIYT